MTDPVSLSILAHATIAFLAQHSPWIADKVGGAAVTQAVRETWDTVKHKLSSTPEGSTAIARLEAQTVSQPADPATLKGLEPQLVKALESDPDFAAKLRSLVITGSDNQVAQGDNNKQAKVDNSADVKIKIS
jgi:hypothetical protein